VGGDVAAVAVIGRVLAQQVGGGAHVLSPCSVPLILV
jgi:hypothetical protein